jgi:hypothetical protein
MEWRDVSLAFGEIVITVGFFAVFRRWAWAASIPRGGRVLVAGTIAAVISAFMDMRDWFHGPSPPIAYVLLALAWLVVTATGVVLLVADRRAATFSRTLEPSELHRDA